MIFLTLFFRFKNLLPVVVAVGWVVDAIVDAIVALTFALTALKKFKINCIEKLISLSKLNILPAAAEIVEGRVVEAAIEDRNN